VVKHEITDAAQGTGAVGSVQLIECLSVNGTGSVQLIECLSVNDTACAADKEG
jgi:hypothetical protein